MSSKSSVLLDVDRSIIENNLLLQDIQHDGLEDLFPVRKSEEGDVAWKLVTPSPGMCVKTRTSDGNKLFINVCQTPEVPAPDDISEEKLMEIWTSEIYSSFKVPMSIGDGHDESDKSGNSVMAYDVAVNPKFFKKVEGSKLFCSFLITVILEGLQDKYNLEIQTNDYVILKNRKVLGEIQPHRVRKGGKKKPAGPLIQEITPAMPIVTQEPQYRIIRKPSNSEKPEYLQAEFLMQNLVSSYNLTLDVGEDRIILDSPGKSGPQAYKLDVFIPYSIDQEKCSATFNTDSKILTLKMPVLAS